MRMRMERKYKPGIIVSLKAFWLGMREFRDDMTTHYDPPLIEWYDWGREWAHRLTLRHFDH